MFNPSLTYNRSAEKIAWFNENLTNDSLQHSLQDKLSHTAKMHKDRIAIEYGEKFLSYGELDRRSTLISSFMINRKIENGSFIGIMIEDRIELISVIIGTLKARCVFMPLDTWWLPDDAIRERFKSTDTRFVFCDKENEKRLKQIFKKDKRNGNIFLINDEFYRKNNGHPGEKAKITYDNQDPVYVCFTSGTTGTPNAVIGKNISLLHFIEWQSETFGVNPSSRVSQLAAAGFDIYLRNIFLPLLCGAAICIPENKKQVMVRDKLVKWIDENKITLIDCAPTIFNIFNGESLTPKHFAHLKYIILAGEPVNPYKLKNWYEIFDDRIQLVNAYGPTETTLFKACYFIQKNDIERNNIPVGKPIRNARMILLDKDMKICTLGQTGEIHIRTPYMTLGYHNNQELNARKFVQNPFTRKNEVIYKSGDLGRELPGGNIEILGRVDRQIKIRGIRIELEEIEYQLQKYTKIEEVTVIVKEDRNKEKYLCAYFTSDQKVTSSELRKYLLKILPKYMVPSHFIKVKDFPLTSNGKIDRKTLPDPELEVVKIKPLNETEKKLLSAWSEVLNIAEADINTNSSFFELGGNSLKVIELISNLIKDCKITADQIYQYDTIAQLAPVISFKKNNLVSVFKGLKKTLLENVNKNEKTLQYQLKKEYENYKFRAQKELFFDLNKGEKEYKHILLTGTTGFLGAHLAFEFLKKKDTTLSVLIRGKTLEDAEDRLRRKLSFYFGKDFYDKNREKIQVIKGNLGENNFGVNKSLFRILSEKVDAIVHCAANVNHIGRYEDFYRDNVMGTEHMLELAADGRKKDFHYISTTGVCTGIVPGKKHILFTEYQQNSGQQISNVYRKSKLEAEKKVVSFMKRGLTTSIYRIGNLVFNSKSGMFQENIEDNAFYSILKSFITLGIIPEVKALQWDFSFIDCTAKSLAVLITQKALVNQIFHLYNPHKVSFTELADLLNGIGIKMKTVKPQHFFEILSHHLNHSKANPGIERLLFHLGVFSQDLFNESVTMSRIVSDRTQSILKQLDFEWPAVNIEHINQMIHHCKNVNYLNESS